MSTLPERLLSLAGDVASIFTRMRPYRFVGEDAACNLCGGLSHDVVGTRDRYGNKLRMVLCSSCGLVFANPMPTEDEVGAFYAHHYRKHYHNAYKPRPKSIMKGIKGAKQRFEFLEPMLDDGVRLLDVGSADGVTVSFFRDKRIDAHGIEPNEGFARYSIETHGIPVQVSTWQDARIAPESFDVVTAHHVIEHFRTPLQAMTRFREWLKPGGHLYVSVPDAYSPQRTPYGRFHFAHLHYFDREALIMMSLKAGFEVSERFPDHSTTLVLKKVDAPNTDWFRYPDNYEKMAHYFRKYTNLKYFCSLKAYTRWIQRMSRLGGNMFEATFLQNWRRD